MKKIILICNLLVALFFMGGCSDNIDTPVLTEDEYPRILGRWPDFKDEGKVMGSFDIPLNQVLVVSLQFTPAALCEGIWYLDGREIHRGTVLEYVPSTQGSFHLELIVKTATRQTSRQAMVNVIEPTPEQ